MTNLKKQYYFINALLALLIPVMALPLQRTSSKALEAARTVKLPAAPAMRSFATTGQPSYGYWKKYANYDQWTYPEWQKKAATGAAIGGAGLAGSYALWQKLKEFNEAPQEKKIKNFLKKLEENPNRFTTDQIISYTEDLPELVSKYSEYSEKFFKIMLSKGQGNLNSLIKHDATFRSNFVDFLANYGRMGIMIMKGLGPNIKDSNIEVLVVTTKAASEEEKEKLANSISYSMDFWNIYNNEPSIFQNFLENGNQNIAKRFAETMWATRMLKGRGSVLIQKEEQLDIFDKLTAVSNPKGLLLTPIITDNFDSLIKTPTGKKIIQRLVEQKNESIIKFLKRHKLLLDELLGEKPSWIKRKFGY